MSTTRLKMGCFVAALELVAIVGEQRLEKDARVGGAERRP
jgi:hypothetical protein